MMIISRNTRRLFTRWSWLSLIGLASCSGVSKVCDPAGVCLETWRSVGAVSNVTVSQLRDKSGPVAGTTVSTTGGGVVSFVDPFASDATTTATLAKGMGW